MTTDFSEDFFPIWTNQEVTKYTLIHNIKSIEDCENKINHFLDHNFDKIGPFVIQYQSKTIGLSGAMSPGSNNIYGIFYHFDKPYWGKGFGTETVNFLISELLNISEEIEIIAEAVTKNIASWKILKKMVFKENLCFKMHLKMNMIYINIRIKQVITISKVCKHTCVLLNCIA